MVHKGCQFTIPSGFNLHPLEGASINVVLRVSQVVIFNVHSVYASIGPHDIRR